MKEASIQKSPFHEYKSSTEEFSIDICVASPGNSVLDQKKHLNSEGVVKWAIWTGLGVASGCSKEACPNGCICPVGLDHSKSGKVQTKIGLGTSLWSSSDLPVQLFGQLE